MPSLQADIAQALATRLASITEANGYDCDVKNVWADDMPLGLEMQPHDLPAIFVIDEGAQLSQDHGTLDVQRTFRLQLVHSRVPDSVMAEVVRAVAKAVFANSPTAQVQTEFRSIHPRVYQVRLIDAETDLNLLEANRIASLRLVVHYRTKPFDL
jgi:hypothetical protein